MMFDESRNSTPSVGTTSPTLVRGLHNDDPQAWQQLVDQYGPLVYRWCRLWGLQASCAADLVQEVLKVLVLRADQFSLENERASFRGWLWTITHNKVRDYYRKIKSGRPAIGMGGTDALNMLANTVLPVADASVKSQSSVRLADAVYRALELIRDDFSEQTWSAFWLITLEECTSTIAAQELGMSSNAVRLAKGRILRRLREVLNLENSQSGLN